MIRINFKITTIILAIITIILSLIILGSVKAVDCSKPSTFSEQRFLLDKGFQTSAKYLKEMAKLNACQAQYVIQKKLAQKEAISPEDQLQLEQILAIFALSKDIEIKASSYALINKVFFWLSLFFAICIIALPIASTLTKDDSKLNKILNPAQLPAITLLAGLCFNFYSEYKGKQTSAENVMRYTYFSQDPVQKKSEKVRKAIAEIDNGHDFSELIKD